MKQKPPLFSIELTQIYTTKLCRTCPVKQECSKAENGKAIQRSEYQEYINCNKERIENNKEYYRQRQAIVEHPYGTLKRQWGFDYILTKGYIEKAEADAGLMFIAYNLRRIINILGANVIKNYLKEVMVSVFGNVCHVRLEILNFRTTEFFAISGKLFSTGTLKGLYLIKSKPAI